MKKKKASESDDSEEDEKPKKGFFGKIFGGFGSSKAKDKSSVKDK